MVNAGTDPAAEGSTISLPKGGGSVGGLGEKFSPDLFTGTGNFSVPIAVPAGRLGMQPQLSLAYSTGSGNGPFGLGWQLSLPGVSRKTSQGVPRYADAAGLGADRADVYIVSGAEDLVPVAGSYPGRVRYRPRTEGASAPEQTLILL
jgi:Salmonella virulence plasmid 65kDa B protein